MAGSTRSNRVQYNCSFCGKSQDQVKRLIAGPGSVYICNECVDLCQEIISEETQTGKAGGKSGERKLRTPQELVSQLDEYIVGQDHTKRVLSVAVYNHFKRVDAPVLEQSPVGATPTVAQITDFLCDWHLRDHSASLKAASLMTKAMAPATT